MDLKTYFKTRSQVEFAKAIGVTPGAVNQWVNGAALVSSDRCPDIEQITGGLVRCEDLRPDVNWAVLRGTGGAPNASDQERIEHERREAEQREAERRAGEASQKGETNV